MLKIGLVIESKAHGRRISAGVFEGIENRSEVNLIELPHHPNGQPPLRSHLEEFDVLIVYVDRKHTWIPEIARKGVRVISCGGDWLGEPNIIHIGTNLVQMLDIVIDHFAALGFPRLAFFGYKALSDPHRARLVSELEKKANPWALRWRLWK
jgi:hypothetical protein